MIKFTTVFSLICLTFSFSAFAADDTTTAAADDSAALPTAQDAQKTSDCFKKLAEGKAFILGKGAGPEARNLALTEARDCIISSTVKNKDLPTKIDKDRQSYRCQ